MPENKPKEIQIYELKVLREFELKNAQDEDPLRNKKDMYDQDEFGGLEFLRLDDAFS